MGIGAWEREASQPKLMVAIPYTGTVTLEWALRFKQLQLPPHIVQIASGQPIDFARNSLVDVFLKSPCEHLFFLDTDNIPPEGAVLRLLSHGFPIVSGLYFTRHIPIVPAMWMKTNVEDHFAAITTYQKNILMEVDAIGMGSCLIHRRVFEKLKEQKLNPFFRWMHDPTKEGNNKGVSEDFYFCKQARALGFKIIVDTSVVVGHVGMFKVGDEGKIGGQWQ